jgi:hypothetical protein
MRIEAARRSLGIGCLWPGNGEPTLDFRFNLPPSVRCASWLGDRPRMSGFFISASEHCRSAKGFAQLALADFIG